MFEKGHVSDKYDNDSSDWEDNTPLSSLAEFGVISQAAAGIKKGLDLSMQDASDGEGSLSTESEITERYNNWTRKLAAVQQNGRVNRKRMKELDRGLDELIGKLYDTVLDDGEWGQAGGGGKSMEWYGTC